MNSKTILFFILVLIACLSQFNSDIYAPAIPTIANNWEVSLHLVEFSMPVYLFGVAISTLIYGPLSEVIGRKRSLLIGLLITLTGSLICSLSSNIDVLLTGRVMQGIGAGACACLWRSIFRDTYAAEELAKYGSYLSLIIVL